MSSVITEVAVQVFKTEARTAVDSYGHRHPGPSIPTTQALLRITDSDGVSGYVLGKTNYLREDQVEQHFRPVLIGTDPLHREEMDRKFAIRQRTRAVELPEHTCSYLDQALWDLAGNRFDTPVWKLLGGARSEVKAYASTMCGDTIEGGLSTPQEYANFAVALKNQGYQGIKLHTWMPPLEGAPSLTRDIEACAAVRDAVGPGFSLMLDGYHWYSRTDALKLGRELDALKFDWFEEPMDEFSMRSYKWLADQIDTPVIGPETTPGRHRSRADWIADDACDILRVGAMNGGGITPALKTVHMADGFGLECEIHGNGAPNLALVGGAPNIQWYERGLLHPLVDYDWVPPHLKSIVDPIDANGMVQMPSRPGLGEDIDLEYISNNLIAEY
ncbi:enolase C-terminal domain-like protein [Rhodococcus sp. IEGM 1354]|uniref:enolase C-terminal domain-like protein n=1 Tax=Nocardiaceae TaxID=85025 RepID=UPI00050CFC15|nr:MULTISPECIES: enolase C-terminal domain-like protein [Rhodococcus]MDI9929307.1 enolase C-terminal domain-like protein [Rhodococcus sp. IEGM 1354]